MSRNLVLFALMVVASVNVAVAKPPDKLVVGYLAGWSDRYGPTNVPADKLTHINYAFAVIRDGEIFARGGDEKFAELRRLKTKHPHLRTLISVGGWSGSRGFSDAALTDESRKKFARSCVAFVHKHGFDGVDIDWEYPGGGGHQNAKSRPEDTKNFTLLLQELRRQLDAPGDVDKKRYLLTIAAPAGGAMKRIELEQIHESLDFINLMTYDFAGPWSKTTSFNAPLFGQMSADASVKAYLAAGVPPEKIVLGVPFYARAWGGVADVDRGLRQPHKGEAPKATGSGAEWAYRSVSEHYVGKLATRHWNDEAKVPWLFNADKGLFVSYDDPESIRLKAEYARDHNLGGVMIWELSQDDAKHSLLNAIHAGLTSP